MHSYAEFKYDRSWQGEKPPGSVSGGQFGGGTIDSGHVKPYV